MLSVRKFLLLSLLITCTPCAAFQWQRGKWNVNDAMIQCERARSKVSYPARCDDSTSDTSMNGYGEVWLVDTRTDTIKKIWVIK